MLATIEGTVWTDIDADALFDFFENPLSDVTMYLDANRDGMLNDGEVTTLTNDRGEFRFEGLAPGEYFVGQVLETTDDTGTVVPVAQTSPGIAGRSNLSGDYDIELVFIDSNLPSELRTLVETAAARWEQIIRGDTAGNPSAGIDDLRLTIATKPLNGPLAQAGPRTTTTFPTENELFTSPTSADRGLTITGAVEIDDGSLSNSLRFVNTLTHEIGHTLGIGFLWERFLTGETSPNSGQFGQEVRYIGPNGVREFERFGGTGGIPIQPVRAGHFDEGVFDTELMTPTSEGGDEFPPDADLNLAPLSRMTIGVIEDLGYDVSYASAQPYAFMDLNGDGIVNALDAIGALPEDLASIGARSFQYAVEILGDDEVIDDANFGVRFNSDPNPFFFNAGPFRAAPGQDVRLLAEIDTTGDADFEGDIDFRDSVTQVNFYRESNGIEGLQTPTDVRRGNATEADTLLEEDANPSDGFDFSADTTNLPDGEVTFYAEAYDRGYFTTVRSDTVEIVSGQTEIPARPGSLAVIGINENQFLIEFNDNDDDESGYLLQVSSEEGFDVPAAIDDVFLPPQEDTGVYSFVYTLPEADPGRDDFPNSTRFFRVRAFNTVGSTAFAGRPSARTLGPDEFLIDNNDADRVTVDDLNEVVDRDSSDALTYLRGSGTATYTPVFDVEGGEEGEYTVFANVPNVDNTAGTIVEVFDRDGAFLGGRTFTDGDAGTNVLVGQFDLTDGSFIRFRSADGDTIADSVRLLRSDSDD